MSEYERDARRERLGSLRELSERLIGMTAAAGIETVDSPFIAKAQEAAAEIGRLFELAVDEERIGLQCFFAVLHRKRVNFRQCVCLVISNDLVNLASTLNKKNR